jgi:hypothetical protein
MNMEKGSKAELVHSTELNLSWEANSCAASEKIPGILWNFIAVLTTVRHYLYPEPDSFSP